MIRVLVMIAVAGFLAGVVALAGAAALGGPDLAARNWNWDVDWHDRHERREWRDRDLRRDRPLDRDAGEVTRELAWELSSAGMMPSRRQVRRKASTASSSVAET